MTLKALSRLPLILMMAVGMVSMTGCASRIERLEKERDVWGLIDALGDAEPALRQDAADALVRIGDAAVEPLISILAYSDPPLCMTAAEVLGRIGSPRARQALVEALIAPAPDVRIAAAEALGEIGEPAVGPLIEALRNPFSLPLQEAAADVLSRMGEPAIGPLIAELKDEYGEVREAAARTLGGIDDPRAVEPLIAVLEAGDPDWQVRQAAAQALGQIGDPRAVEPLLAMLKAGDSNWQVRQTAAAALDEVGWEPDDSGAAAWYWAAKHDWGGASDLGSVAVEPLLAALRSGDEEERKAVAEELATIGEPAVEPLIAVMRDVDWPALEAIADALGQIGTPAIERLITELDTSDESQRTEWVLVRACKETPEVLVPYLRDNRTVAVYGVLIRLGSPGTEAALMEALDGFGTKEMAEDYLNCGNDKLEAAAEEWAQLHGYTIVAQGGRPGPYWGSK